MSSQQHIIETHALTKTYQMGDVEVRALAGVDLAIEQGEFVAIMGPSGSGKSTLMNILGCLDRPTSGEYCLDGERVSDLTKEQLAAVRNRQLGFVFQSYNLLAGVSAIDNVMVPMIYDRQQRDQRHRRIGRAREALTSVGLGDRLMHRPEEMSGGQRQRVAIARALINDPALILADEPTGNLDTTSGDEIMGILQDLHSRGRTIIMVTHEPEIAQYTQRVIHVRDGLIERCELVDHAIREGIAP